MIRKALKGNVKLSLWLLEVFTNQDIIREFLIDCPVHDMARFVSGLLKSAMQTVYQFEEQSIANYIKQMDSSRISTYIKSVSSDKLLAF